VPEGVQIISCENKDLVLAKLSGNFSTFGTLKIYTNKFASTHLSEKDFRAVHVDSSYISKSSDCCHSKN
jgi:hypothetical protein